MLPPLAEWQATLDTVHRWVQIVGKIRLARSAPANHSWHAALYVTSRGLTTSPIFVGTRAFEIALDFVDHRVHVDTSAGERRSLSLTPMSVADFYGWLTRGLAELGLRTEIWPMVVEIPGPRQPFPADHVHADYDRAAMTAFWRALVQSDRVLRAFRARFVGKASPVHFFWGAFDLAVTRFSGRPAPLHPGGVPNCPDYVMQEAYSHEVSSAGFWPGPGFGEAAFYAYAYPEPDGFGEASVRPAAAIYHPDLHEFILPYDAVRTAPDPDATLMAFLETTHAAAADLAHWPRPTLESA